MTSIFAERLTDFLLRNATAIIFIAVFVFFGLQSVNFFGPEVSATSSSSVVHRRDRRRHDLRPADGGHRPLGWVEHVSLGNGRRLLPADPAKQNGFGALAAITIGLCAGALFGAVNAFCIVVLRITPFLVTLATLVAGRGLGTAITKSYRILQGICSFGAWSLVRAPETPDGSPSA